MASIELRILDNDSVEAKLGRRAAHRGPVRETETEGPLIPGIYEPLLFCRYYHRLKIELSMVCKLLHILRCDRGEAWLSGNNAPIMATAAEYQLLKFAHSLQTG